jgi:uncharacterized protein (DUF305 family)
MRRLWLVLSVSALAAACGASGATGQGAPIVQPGAPGQETREITAAEAARLPQPEHTAADVRFMQGMIGHHAQALEMTDLLKTRTKSDDMRKLALRIEVSQRDEIKRMQEWLGARGEALPDPHAHHAHDAALMPGMLTAAEMQRLAAASGREFDRLFLELMIKHHEGALVMVRELFASPGAAQDGEVFAFASDVDADQRMEIVRMSAMLKELQ